MWTAVTNGMGRTKAEAGIAKAMGQRAGWPDLQMVWKGRAICIEFKAPKGRETPVQSECMADLTLAGAAVRVVRTLEGLYDFLSLLGVPLKARPA